MCCLKLPPPVLDPPRQSGIQYTPVRWWKLSRSVYNLVLSSRCPENFRIRSQARAKYAQHPSASACHQPQSGEPIRTLAAENPMLWTSAKNVALLPLSDVRREGVWGGSGQSPSWGPTTVFYQTRQGARKDGSWLGSLLWTPGLMSGDQEAVLMLRGVPGPPPAQAAFRITSGNRCMHTQTAHHSFLGTHAHTHVCSVSEGDRLLRRLHSAAVVAA